jgi:hypothetical protein
MKTRIILTLLLIFFIPILTFGQGKKTIASKQIASQTVYEYFVSEGLKEPVIETIEVYDSVGNVIEQKEFNSEGDLKNWQKFKFDKNDKKIEESTLNVRGKVLERIVWIYENDLVIEKQYYDQKNRLTKRKEYQYEFRTE